MSEENILKKINSKYILKEIFSLLPMFISHSIIKYNKKFQKIFDINYKDTIFNFQYNIYSKKETMLKIKDSLYYSKNHPDIVIKNIGRKNIFLTKYKGFKINDYPLPSDFDSMKNINKIAVLTILENNELFYKYTLTNENINLINLIDEFRIKNGLNKLIYNKIEDIKDFFELKNSNNEKYLFIYHSGEFKNRLVKNDENITKILLIKSLKFIIILEKENNEYVFIYSDNNEQKQLKINNNNVINSKNFHIINNTIPTIQLNRFNHYLRKNCLKLLKLCFNFEGFQFFSLKDSILIGVLEGPPNTPYENGYFLFEMYFPSDFSFVPPKFTFITKIFHPNISEMGNTSIDILGDKWSPVLKHLNIIIYSVQSLLDDPNPDDFVNEEAAKLYKKDRNAYDKYVREYTSIYANYSKFLDDLKNMNIIQTINEEGKEFKFIEEKDEN